MLPELQYGFRRMLLGDPDPALAAAVLGDGLPAEARLRLYRNHVILSLREALQATFPIVCRLVGDEFFAGMARAFVSAHPPRTPCLFEYGDALPGFIAGFAPAASLPYLADVARLEWAMNAAYHAPVETGMTAAALAAIEPDRLAPARLILQPSLCVLVSDFPVEAIWRANQPNSDGGGVALDAGGGAWLVWRQEDDAVFRAVEPAVAGFVVRLQAGVGLGQAIVDTVADDPTFDPGAVLGLLLGNGLLVGIADVAVQDAS